MVRQIDAAKRSKWTIIDLIPSVNRHGKSFIVGDYEAEDDELKVLGAGARTGHDHLSITIDDANAPEWLPGEYPHGQERSHLE